MVSKKLLLALGMLTIVTFTATSEAKHKSNDDIRNSQKNSQQDRRQNGKFDQRQNDRSQENQQQAPSQGSTGDINSDQAIVDAANSKRRMNFIQGGNMEVIKLLPDDTSGLKHQKWIVRLSNGQTMAAVYNLDLCERVPVKIGDKVSLGGEFIWTGQGALLHWLHKDPKNLRPAGFVGLNGKFYCRD